MFVKAKIQLELYSVHSNQSPDLMTIYFNLQLCFILDKKKKTKTKKKHLFGKQYAGVSNGKQKNQKPFERRIDGESPNTQELH